MSKYYSLETLIEAEQNTFCDMYDLEAFLDEIPADKVIEITRCKACKYYHSKNSLGTQGICMNGKMEMNYLGEFYPYEDDFCSYAEPKEIEDVEE